MSQNIIHIFGFLALSLVSIPVFSSLFSAQIIPLNDYTFALAAACSAACVIVSILLFRHESLKK